MTAASASCTSAVPMATCLAARGFSRSGYITRAPTSGNTSVTGPVHDALRAALARSAEFWLDLLVAAELDAADALPVLWELVWAGEVTNDAWAPLRAKRRYGVPIDELLASPRAQVRQWSAGEVPARNKGRGVRIRALELRARADLARYLQLHPDASDSGPLRERLVELSSGPARTN